jgi:hypothetical protein
MRIAGRNTKEIVIIQIVIVKDRHQYERGSLGKTEEIILLSNNGIRFSNTDGKGCRGSWKMD